jgi:hypothetical protein
LENFADFKEKIIDLGPFMSLDDLDDKQRRFVEHFRKGDRYQKKWAGKGNPAQPAAPRTPSPQAGTSGGPPSSAPRLKARPKSNSKRIQRVPSTGVSLEIPFVGSSQQSGATIDLSTEPARLSRAETTSHDDVPPSSWSSEPPVFPRAEQDDDVFRTPVQPFSSQSEFDLQHAEASLPQHSERYEDESLLGSPPGYTNGRTRAASDGGGSLPDFPPEHQYGGTSLESEWQGIRTDSHDAPDVNMSTGYVPDSEQENVVDEDTHTDSHDAAFDGDVPSDNGFVVPNNDDNAQFDDFADIDDDQQDENDVQQDENDDSQDSGQARRKEPEPPRRTTPAEDGNNSTNKSGSTTTVKKLSRNEEEYRKTMDRVFDAYREMDVLLDQSEYGLLKLIEETLDIHFDGRRTSPDDIAQGGTDDRQPAVFVKCRNLLELATYAWYSVELVDILMSHQMPQVDGVYTPSSTLASVLLTSARDGLATLMQLCEDFHLGVDQTHNRIRTILCTGAHFFALDVDLEARTVIVYDSGDTRDDSEDYTPKLRNIVEALCRDRSWEGQTEEWNVSWARNVYHQKGGFDCGAHAVDNFMKLMFGVAPSSDGPTGVELRYIHMVRIRAMLDRTELSGERLLEASSTLTHSRPRPAGDQHDAPSAGARPPPVGRVHQAVEDAMNIHSDGFQDLCELSTPKPYEKATARQILQLIALRGDPERQGMSKALIVQRFEGVYTMLGLSIPSRDWWSRYVEYRGKRSMFRSSGKADKKRFSLKPNVEADEWESSIKWLGNLDDYWNRYNDTRCDLHTRPEVVFLPVRATQTESSNLGAEFSRQIEELVECGRRTFHFYRTVFWGDVEHEPMEIDMAEDMNQVDHPWFHIYPMIRASECDLFLNDAGIPHREDEKVMGILSAVNETAGNEGRRILVTFVIAGLDNWTTRWKSLLRLLDDYPHLDFRLTYVMPAQSVQRVRVAFTPRPSSFHWGPLWAWAHFDLRVINEIRGHMQYNSRHPFSLERLDQTVLIHMLEDVERYKYLASDFSEGPWAIESDRANEPARDWVHVKRNRMTLRYPILHDACCACRQPIRRERHRPEGRPTTQDVVCDSCYAESRDFENDFEDGPALQGPATSPPVTQPQGLIPPPPVTQPQTPAPTLGGAIQKPMPPPAKRPQNKGPAIREPWTQNEDKQLKAWLKARDARAMEAEEVLPSRNLTDALVPQIGTRTPGSVRGRISRRIDKWRAQNFA